MYITKSEKFILFNYHKKIIKINLKSSIYFLIVYLLAIIFLALRFTIKWSLSESIRLIEWRLIRYLNRFFIEISTSGAMIAMLTRFSRLQSTFCLANIRTYRLWLVNRRMSTREKEASNGFSKDAERWGRSN